ncbi:MAG: hypothetical protein JWM48_2117 [Mycobacterium sp.]|nr:hypothetical protein [Mycobacterium sp.]
MCKPVPEGVRRDATRWPASVTGASHGSQGVVRGPLQAHILPTNGTGLPVAGRSGQHERADVFTGGGPGRHEPDRPGSVPY